MNQRLLHTPEGVRDIYGSEYEKKLAVEDRLHALIAGYGYEDISTPTFEYFDVFSKEIGTIPSKELYKFFDKEGNTLALRPDFTPSIARCTAKYFREEKSPLRFTYKGNTFINTSSLMGKLKEKTQMGVELINEPSVEADGEMIALVVECLKQAGLKDFQVSIGQVEYFKGLCQEAGLDEETEMDLRACISGKNFFAAQELLMERSVADPYRTTLLKVADLFNSMTSLDDAKKLVHNARSLAAIERLEKLDEVLKLYGVSEHVSYDLGMLSKYNYYTGVIFKAYAYGVGNAIVTGGRYNTLLGRFGKEAAAIGFAIVVDDVMEALSRQKSEFVTEKRSELFYDPDVEGDFAKALAQAKERRSAGEKVVLLAKRS
ncbi:MAG: ATP phosphoribosyltransferase regulatory subunit [Lachnospiraceae bacterium]|nr:ATP phosphoribosyltransferase regulatory subunit [Lachnospiraceae bacterium]